MSDYNKLTTANNSTIAQEQGKVKEGEPMKKKRYYASLKGIALLAFIDSELCPRCDNGWDISSFNVFWDKFEKRLTAKKEK